MNPYKNVLNDAMFLYSPVNGLLNNSEPKSAKHDKLARRFPGQMAPMSSSFPGHS